MARYKDDSVLTLFSECSSLLLLLVSVDEIINPRDDGYDVRLVLVLLAGGKNA